MYSYPPAALSISRKSMAVMSIGDVEVTVNNGVYGVMCCFFEARQGHSLSMKNLISFSMFLASKLLTLLGD